MDLETYKQTLQKMLVNELAFWNARLSAETMRAFDLGCHPWHGYLELSFLTIDEPHLGTHSGKFDEIAAWRWYNFTQTFTSGWPQATDIERWMKARWDEAEEKQVVSDVFLGAAVSVVESGPVLAELARYRRTSDFEITVFDPDNRARGNLVRNSRGLLLVASNKTMEPTR